MRIALLRGAPKGALLLLLLLLPLESRAITVGIELFVTRNDQPGVTVVPGGPDAATNTPVDLAVAPGDTLQISVLITFGLPIRLYQTLVTTDDPASVDYVNGSAQDISTLGFSGLADPDATLQDGDPESGEADSNLCPPPNELCVAPSTNIFYELEYQVVPGFTQDALRDITIAIESITFDRAEDSLDPNADTASLRLTLIPEPATALLLGAGLAGLTLAGRRRS